MTLPCPLCQTADTPAAVQGGDSRSYYHCLHCDLIYVDPDHFLSPDAERLHYATHQNSLDNAGYVVFLQRLLHPLLPHVNATMRGLDYGSGPGPTLSKLLRLQGLTCDDYDPMFAPGPLQAPYDFICATECFEHFHQPALEIRRLCDLLSPHGLLAVMTELWTDIAQFPLWRYARDPTHTVFYHARSLAFIQRSFGFDPLATGDSRVTLWRRRLDVRNAFSPSDAASLLR